MKFLKDTTFHDYSTPHSSNMPEVEINTLDELRAFALGGETGQVVLNFLPHDYNGNSRPHPTITPLIFEDVLIDAKKRDEV